MERLGVQVRADVAKGPGEVMVGSAAHERLAGIRRVETNDHAHRRRLARAVRSHEPGHPAGANLEAEIVYRRCLPVALGESFHLDHRISSRAMGLVFTVEIASEGRNPAATRM
jgi:hypothetical protein